MFYCILLYSFAVYTHVRAATCANGGDGPCLGNMCPMANQVCINGDTCCQANQVIPDVITTVPPLITTTTTYLYPTYTTATAITSCVDLINTATGVSDCPNRVALCQNSLYYTLMTQQCPRTCGRCTSSGTTTTTTCVDKLNPSTGVSDCTAMAAYCTNSAYYTLMTTQCPKTCGRCTTTSSTTSTTCVDLLNPSTGVSDCPAMAAYCTNSAYYTLMTTQCPKTCGRCSTTSSTTSTTCVDLLNPSTGVSDCSAMAAYCNNSAYYTMMTTQCPKTCGRCTSTSVTSTSTCVDLVNASTGVSSCPSMASYCTVASYVSLMRTQCPRTCGYCTG